MPTFKDRQSEIDGRLISRREEEEQQHVRKSVLRLPLILVILVIGVLIYFQQPIEKFLNETLFPLFGGDDTVFEMPQQSSDYYLPEAGKREPGPAVKTASDQVTENQVAAETPAEVIAVSIKDFKPVELAVHPVSQEMELFETPTYVVNALPDNLTSGQLKAGRFGSVYLHRAGMVSVYFVPGSDRHLLYLDDNQNADLSDDGTPFSAPSAAFEITLALPLAELSGIPQLQGEYRLWIYQPPREGGVLRFYPFTQLSGEVEVEGQKYPAVIAENFSIDGDFSNDGIFVDRNRDSFFNVNDEYVRPGKTMAIGEGSYSFDIQP